MNKLQFFSIGVYGLSSQEFFNKLIANKIDTFVDIRNRRAVRGPAYAFVNSERLQSSLKTIGIEYLHEVRLAPTNEIRAIQKKADAKSKIKNSERGNLEQSFIKSYKEMILDNFNIHDFISSLLEKEASKVVLFCVEQNHEACHRSIVTKEIEKKLGLRSIHL